MVLIETEADIERGLAALLEIDPRLVAVAKAAGPVPLRLQPPGLPGLCGIIVSQQVSKASANAIFARLREKVDLTCPETLSHAPEEVFRTVGLSRPKEKTLRALGRAMADGFSLDDLRQLSSEEAIWRLVELHGIGAWTAEVYLMFCLGHPDLFPGRDVALQSAVGHALGHDTRPGEKALIGIAESWRPWRAVAARLFWAYYASLKGGRSALPV